jgi:hypothetical protein
MALKKLRAKKEIEDERTFFFTDFHLFSIIKHVLSMQRLCAKRRRPEKTKTRFFILFYDLSTRFLCSTLQTQIYIQEIFSTFFYVISSDIKVVNLQYFLWANTHTIHHEIVPGKGVKTVFFSSLSFQSKDWSLYMVFLF